MIKLHEASEAFATQVVETGGATLEIIRNRDGIQGFELPPNVGYMVSYKVNEDKDFLVMELTTDEDWLRQNPRQLVELRSADLFQKLWMNATLYNADGVEDAEFIGAWIENNTLIGDYSKHFDDLDAAIAFGKANEQTAIYDLANKTSIYL